jgi:hypothetical protein
MSPTSAVFWSRVLTKTSLFPGIKEPGGASGERGSFRGGLLYEPVDLCHLVIAKTSFIDVTESSLSRQNFRLARRTAFLSVLQAAWRTGSTISRVLRRAR